jgi:GTP-binding protein Era
MLEAWATVRDFAAVVPVAAKNGDGVRRLLAEVGKLVPKGEALYPEDELTDKPVRFLVAELVREQILRRTRQEVPHGVAVTVETWDEGARGVRITVTVHVAKESHKGILIGDGGKMLAAIGTAARKRAEEMLGQRVRLETWVRATPRWFDDPARLAELGYGEET